jgi:hypothetical protein
MKLVGHVAHMEEGINAYRAAYWLETSKGETTCEMQV